MHVGSKKLLREKISLVYYIIIKNKNRNKYERNLIEIKKSLKNDNKSIEIELNERIKNKYETNCGEQNNISHCISKIIVNQIINNPTTN
jgi:hypothetical protein